MTHAGEPSALPVAQYYYERTYLISIKMIETRSGVFFCNLAVVVRLATFILLAIATV